MGKKAKPVHVEVTPRKNESPERMIKRFIKKTKKEGRKGEKRRLSKLSYATALRS